MVKTGLWRVTQGCGRQIYTEAAGSEIIGGTQALTSQIKGQIHRDWPNTHWTELPITCRLFTGYVSKIIAENLVKLLPLGTKCLAQRTPGTTAKGSNWNLLPFASFCLKANDKESPLLPFASFCLKANDKESPLLPFAFILFYGLPSVLVVVRVAFIHLDTLPLKQSKCLSCLCRSLTAALIRSICLCTTFALSGGSMSSQRDKNGNYELLLPALCLMFSVYLCYAC